MRRERQKKLESSFRTVHLNIITETDRRSVTFCATCIIKANFSDKGPTPTLHGHFYCCQKEKKTSVSIRAFHAEMEKGCFYDRFMVIFFIFGKLPPEWVYGLMMGDEKKKQTVMPKYWVASISRVVEVIFFFGGWELQDVDIMKISVSICSCR